MLIGKNKITMNSLNEQHVRLKNEVISENFSFCVILITVECVCVCVCVCVWTYQERGVGPAEVLPDGIICWQQEGEIIQTQIIWQIVQLWK